MAVAVIGHVTKDTVINSLGEKSQTGGTAYYTAIALARLGIKTHVYTKLAEGDRALLSPMHVKNIELFPSFCRHTTSFRNVYPKKGTDYREQFVGNIAEPFEISDISNVKVNIVHLGPLTKSDIPLDVLEYLKSLGVVVSLDMQGFMRKIAGKKVSKAKWKDAKKFLRHVDILKADISEAELITGKGGFKKLASMGPIEVLITNGQKGSIICSRKKQWRIPAFNASIITDATGAGDTYIAGYLAKRIESNDIKECGRFAAMCATMKIENGFFNAAKKDVEKRLKDS